MSYELITPELIEDVLYGAAVFIAGVSCNISCRLVKDRKYERDAICSLLRNELVGLHHSSVERGYILTTERESVDLMSNAYFQLGGNGMVHHLMKDINNLPVHDPPSI